MPKPDSQHGYHARLVPRLALPGSEKVSEYFIAAVVSTALRKYCPIFQLQKKMTFREKNWLVQQDSGVHLPPSPVHAAATGSDPAQRAARRREMRCSCIPCCRQCPGEGSMVRAVPQAGGHRCRHSQAVIAWDPHQLCRATRSFLPPRSSARQRVLRPALPLRWDPSCVGWKEDRSYKPLVKTEYLLVCSSREVQLRLTVAVRNAFCIIDETNALVCGWM